MEVCSKDTIYNFDKNNENYNNQVNKNKIIPVKVYLENGLKYQLF